MQFKKKLSKLLVFGGQLVIFVITDPTAEITVIKCLIDYLKKNWELTFDRKTL